MLSLSLPKGAPVSVPVRLIRPILPRSMSGEDGWCLKVANLLSTTLGVEAERAVVAVEAIEAVEAEKVASPKGCWY